MSKHEARALRRDLCAHDPNTIQSAFQVGWNNPVMAEQATIRVIQQIAPSELIDLIERGQLKGLKVLRRGRWRTFVEVVFDQVLDEKWQNEMKMRLYAVDRRWRLPVVGQDSTFGWIYGSDKQRVTLIRLKGEIPEQQSAIRRLDRQLQELGLPRMRLRLSPHP